MNVSGEWAVLAWVALFSLATGVLPVATGIAILRYRLYEIDVIIRRTLVHAALVGSLAIVYLAGVVGLGAIFRTLTGQSGALAVTLSTLAVAAAFQPLRHRIQRVVDRRLYRGAYDAAETLDRLAARLRSEVDLDELRADVLTAVRSTVQPAHATLWIRR